MDPTIWLIGDARAEEFAEPLAFLKQAAACRSFDTAHSAVAAARSLRHEPGLILFLAARPGAISQRQVDAVNRAYPLSRLAALLGPWCEGEVRSGRPWPGVPRAYWHQWPERLAQWIAQLDHDALPRLPRTATEVDRLLASKGPVPTAAMAVRVGVVAALQADYASLASALEPLGGECRWLLPGETETLEPLGLLLIDAAGDVDSAMQNLQFIRSVLGQVPALVLGEFPRLEETRTVAASPRTSLLARPYLVGDLHDAMAALLGAWQQQSAPAASAAA